MKTDTAKLAKQLNKHYKYRVYSEYICEACGAKDVGGRGSIYCSKCKVKAWAKSSSFLNESEKVKRDLRKHGVLACTFCKSEKNIHAHHIDMDRSNNDLNNISIVCSKCHRLIHGKLYPSLLKKFFNILIKERFTQEQIGEMFSMSKQHVNIILKK